MDLCQSGPSGLDSTIKQLQHKRCQFLLLCLGICWNVSIEPFQVLTFFSVIMELSDKGKGIKWSGVAPPIIVLYCLFPLTIGATFVQ